MGPQTMQLTLSRGITVGVGAAALALLIATPSLSQNRVVDGGDTPSATRGATVAEDGTGKEMSAVANLQYDNSGAAQSGSDIEFLRTGNREYALAGTLRKGMQIVDITDPTAPKIAAVYDCDISQQNSLLRLESITTACAAQPRGWSRGVDSPHARHTTSRSLPPAQ